MSDNIFEMDDALTRLKLAYDKAKVISENLMDYFEQPEVDAFFEE